MNHERRRKKFYTTSLSHFYLLNQVAYHIFKIPNLIFKRDLLIDILYMIDSAKKSLYIHMIRAKKLPLNCRKVGF